MKVQVGEYESYESGSVMSIENSDVLFNFSEKLNVRLFFIDNNNEEAPKMKVEVINDSEIKYTLTNFKNPMGTELGKLNKIGVFEGKDLFFQFRVVALTGSLNKLVFYTFLKGGDVRNG